MESDRKYSTLSEASIVDLKAELYKKEIEAKRKGVGNIGHNIVSKKSKTLQKIAINTGKTIIKLKEDKIKSKDTDEDEKKLLKVTDCLNAKSKLYDKLKNDVKSGKTNEKQLADKGIMVDFSRKIDEPEISKVEFFDIVQSVESEHRDKMNRKWQEDIQKLQDKPLGQEHYQDIFFNELRDHGVGYYQFSTIEDERQKQMDLLHKLTLETEAGRQKNLQIKLKRDKAIKERLNKLKLRKGLPIDNDEQKTNQSEIAIKQNPPDSTVKESFDEEINDLIEQTKKDYYNDINKKLKLNNEINEEERINEFAPPSNYNIKNKSNMRYNR